MADDAGAETRRSGKHVSERRSKKHLDLANGDGAEKEKKPKKEKKDKKDKKDKDKKEKKDKKDKKKEKKARTPRSARTHNEPAAEAPVAGPATIQPDPEPLSSRAVDEAKRKQLADLAALEAELDRELMMSPQSKTAARKPAAPSVDASLNELDELYSSLEAEKGGRATSAREIAPQSTSVAAPPSAPAVSSPPPSYASSASSEPAVSQASSYTPPPQPVARPTATPSLAVATRSWEPPVEQPLFVHTPLPVREKPTRKVDARLAYTLPSGVATTTDAVSFSVTASGPAVDQRAPISVRVIGADNVELPTTTTADGNDMHRVSYKPRVAGDLQVCVVFKASISVPVTIGTDASRTRVYGPGVENGVQAKEPTYFTIESIGTDGQPVRHGGDNFVVTITGPKGEHVPSVIKDNDDGTYRVEYAAMNPGPTRVEVTLRGKHVANSPYTVMVGDNWADAMKTRAWGPGLEGAMCGQPTEFYVQAVNSLGEPLAIGGEQLRVEIQGPSGTLNPPVSDNGNGTYTVRYQLTEPGPHKISVDLKTKKGKGPWAPIQNSPWTISVTAQPPDASKCKCYGPGLEDGVEARKPTHFTIEAYDKFGKRVPYGGDPFVVSIVGPSGEQVQAPVKDNGDGTYRVVYTPPAGGPTRINVTLLGKPVANSPYTVQVRDFEADPSKTHAWGPGLGKGVKTGVPTEFYIQAVNSSGQNIPVGGEKFRVEINGPAGPQQVPVIDNGNGTYTVRYQVDEPGMHTINVETGRGAGPWMPIKDAPFNVNVTPSGPDVAVNAHWRGVILLNSMQAEEELAHLIETTVPKCVDIFHMRGGDPQLNEFVNSLGRMIELYKEFPKISTVSKEDRARADREIEAMTAAQREVAHLLSQVPRGQSLTVDAGKVTATHIKKFMNSMIVFTDLMENQQKRNLLLALMQALQGVQIMKEVNSPLSYQQNIMLYEGSFSRAENLLKHRLDCLAQMGETQTRPKYVIGLNALQYHRATFSNAVEILSTDPLNIDNQTAVSQEAAALVQTIKDLAALGTVKASGGIDHAAVDRSLDALRDAVQIGSSTAAADAARDLMGEINKLEMNSAQEMETDPGNAEDALREAAARLKELLKGLLGATKAAINDPSPATNEAFNQQLEAVRVETAHDTISTTLASSGLIDAAAQVSRQLNALFAE